MATRSTSPWTRITIAAWLLLTVAIVYDDRELVARLAAADQQVSNLRSRIAALQSQVAQLESPTSTAPAMAPQSVSSGAAGGIHSAAAQASSSHAAPEQEVEAFRVTVRPATARIAMPDDPSSTAGMAGDSNPGAIVFTARGNKKLYASDYAGAEADYREAVRLDPSSSDALAALGRAQIVRGEVAEAESSFSKALQLNSNPAAMSGLAAIRYHQARYQEAYKLDKDALALVPSSESAVWTMALTLDALGQHDAALPMYRRFLEIAPNSNAAIYAREQLQSADSHPKKP